MIHDDEDFDPADQPVDAAADAGSPDEFADLGDGVRIYEHHRLTVDPKQEPLRIDQFLTYRLSISRSRIKNAALAGFVRVNAQPTRVSYKVRPGDEVSIVLPYPRVPDMRPEPIPLDIVYEDDQLMIINKPAGLVVHPGIGNYSGTLVNGLLYYFNERAEGTTLPAGTAGADGNPEPVRPGLVHRIDKDTSGLLVVAKTESAYNFLSKQFFDRTTDRLYYALVWGNIAGEGGTIVGNITRAPGDGKHYMVSDDPAVGKHAVTHYKVLQRYSVATLVQCKLETGRTHQIRVHMKHIGHTLFSDTFYGGNRMLRGKPSRAYQRFIQACFDVMPRQALHAKTLGFEHPVTRQRLFFDSPLPDDFRNVLLKMAEFMKVEPLPELLGTPIDTMSL